MKDLLPHFKRYWQDPWVKKGLLLFLGSFLSLQLLFYAASFFTPETSAERAAHLPNFSELIPQGYSLVPIQIENEEALDPLVEDFVYADLHLHTLPGAMGPSSQSWGRSTEGLFASKILHGIKLLKKPGQRTRFSALVTQEQSSLLLRPYQTVHAVITSKLNQTQQPILIPKRFQTLEGGI
jgi:hypothetical protein